MKNSIFTFLLFTVFQFHGFAQDHIITLQGTTFTPNNLTINAGETVQWINNGGFHSVNGSQAVYPGNPESFISGAPANAPWTFSHTFNTPGIYDYRCDVHFSMGMIGTITVLPAADEVVITEIMYNDPTGPTDVYEFIELYNNGSSTVNLNGWYFSMGVVFTFPNYNLNPGEYVLVAVDSVQFESAFGVPAFQFAGNNLNNNGESIVLYDVNGSMVDSVTYDDTAPWPMLADGFGPSLVLCDYNADNSNPANWAAAITPTGFVTPNGTEILATPGSDSGCPTGPVIGWFLNELSLLENAGSIFAYLVLSNGNTNQTQVTITVNPASTAMAGVDYSNTFPMTVTFDAGAILDTQIVTINLLDDGMVEDVETLVLDLINPTNGGIVAQGIFNLNIVDNDATQTDALVITGIFDTQVESGGTWAKGVELKALQDIPDLSIFGVGAASNGGGSSGVDTPLPAISVQAGDCIYVSNDSTLFFDFFGFFPTVTGSAANINGDDAIELFENNLVIDVFGDINMDGTGEPWEYLDGWAYRKDGTGPDGSTFVLSNWFFSGIDAFDNVPNNASAPTPFPTCSYSPVAPVHAIANDDNASTDIEAAVTINVLANDALPNPLTSMTVTDSPSNGTAMVNGLTDITYTPNPGFCGTDVFTYEICDAIGCDEGTVTVTVECPATYPAYDIASVTTVGPNGQPDSLGVTMQLQGIVHGIDLQGTTNSIQFTLIDDTGGIAVFSNNDFGYTVTEGDEVIVRGAITQFNCLTQITLDSLWLVSTGNPLVTPELTTFLNEDFESELLRINNLTLVDPGQWLGNGSSFNVDVTNGASTYLMRIDNDSDLSSMPAPSGPFHAIGIGGQFGSGNCATGYQFLPRYHQDIILLNPTQEELLGRHISLYPNPAIDKLFIKTDVKIDGLIISNMLGQTVLEAKNPGEEIDVNTFKPGIYLISFYSGELTGTAKIVKQ